MMSLSKEWALLSRAMYGPKFMDEVAAFLRKNKVKTILECGCGDGNVLRGLADRGFSGLGIDGDPEMIQMANQEHAHPNIKYLTLNWLELGKIAEKYDGVICRGNSLSYVLNWKEGKEVLPEKVIKAAIARSVGLMFERIKPSGLLYVDTVRQEDIDAGTREIALEYPKISLKGRIEYDLERRVRKTYGEGVVWGEEFKGGGESVFITPDEVEKIMKQHATRVWRQKFRYEKNYQAICAMK